MDTHCWLLIVGDVAARDLAREKWHRIVVADGAEALPLPGARLAVLRTHRPDFVARTVVLGTAVVTDRVGQTLEIRHRFVAPAGYEPPLTAVHPRIAAGWTDERVGALVGTALPIPSSDHERIEAAVREQALAHGPEPSRPAHRMPRTPGRRRLIGARLVARKAYPIR
jgi:hypothetical protein